MNTNETDYISHDDARRVNNTTMEQRGFMKVAEEKAPPMLYAREPSLDQQVVWKGKGVQGQQALIGPTAPIHIHKQFSPSTGGFAFRGIAGAVSHSRRPSKANICIWRTTSGTLGADPQERLLTCAIKV